ncbi:MAG: hypothetical protein K2N16_01045 [Muribaculaceae bacterium]|nr:hypothetical protein [Muribaculaceae bacterium]
MGWLARHRHKRGFGVHSPLAFRFIKDCLCEKTPYYDYTSLRKDQRLLYRLAAWLQPGQITALGSADARPATMACPPKDKRKASPWTGLDQVSLAVADARGGVGEAVAAISQGSAVYITNCTKADRAALCAAIDSSAHGQTFSNRSGTLIALPFPGLTPQHFDVAFP